MNRRTHSRKVTLEQADLYYKNHLITQCALTSVSPGGVFVYGRLPKFLRPGSLVELYVSIDRVATPYNKLLCLKGRVTRQTEQGIGVKVYRKRLPVLSGSVPMMDAVAA